MRIQRLLLTLSCVSLADAPSAEVKPPNIVLIVADDLGYADVLFNPQHPPEVTTPHLEALAKESVVCRQGGTSVVKRLSAALT